ncbi:helix-turn-helix domain-containing protein [Caballeronia sp. dw_19]|uniref:helix-turn-helix domain-containing protein n=1 Tax=Caballeronia sp. dw_19 TaxID=2719791 RepID=UPI001BD60F34|nr:helix-turn-helix domain-containing protein [Caballeronia sp. dw_19]
MTDSSEDSTLTLKEAAALLRVSYSTVYSHREDLGFFQVGSIWRVWRSRLMALGTADPRVLENKAVKKAPAKTVETQEIIPPYFTEMTQRQIQEELDRLLNQPRKSRKSPR